ncbi:MAG: exonuclease domain-containing protein [Pseudomonadota bacterium]
MARAIVFDLEYTAWEGSIARGWSGPGELREVVQIGAIAVDADSFEETGTFNRFVRPRFNPVLSDYFTALTGITNARLANEAVGFRTAVDDFAAFMAADAAFAFGRDDETLNDNAALYGLERALQPISGHNIRLWFNAHEVSTDGVCSGEIASAVGAEAGGPIHDAVGDCRSIAAAVRHLMARGAPNPASDLGWSDAT